MDAMESTFIHFPFHPKPSYREIQTFMSVHTHACAHLDTECKLGWYEWTSWV